MRNITKAVITTAAALPVVVGSAGLASAHTTGSGHGYDGYRHHRGILDGVLDAVLGDRAHEHGALLGGILGRGYDRGYYSPSDVQSSYNTGYYFEHGYTSTTEVIPGS